MSNPGATAPESDVSRAADVDPVIAEQALRIIVEKVGGCGLQSAAEKLKVWVPDGSPPPVGFRLAWAPEGLRILGGPIDDGDCCPSSPPGLASPLERGPGAITEALVSERLEGMRTDAEALVARQ